MPKDSAQRFGAGRRSGPDQRRRSLKPIYRPSPLVSRVTGKSGRNAMAFIRKIRPAGSLRQLPPNDLLGSRIHSTWHSPLMIGSA